MYRFLFFALPFCYLLFACNPPARTYPRRVETGLDSTEYAGIVEGANVVDLRKARFLARFKVGDLCVSLDCTYPDVLNSATSMARAIGGNLVVITEHTKFEVKSKCHRIKGDIYAIPSLEGVESRISWHPKRPLMPGDLRGQQRKQNGLPPLLCTISCRVGGDYFKEAILHTESTFWADSSAVSADTVFALRRAQLHFDLAELHARRLKAALADLGADLPAITGQYRSMTARQQAELQKQEAVLDGELSGAGAQQALTRWESNVQGELAALDRYFGDFPVDLRKKKKG